MMADAKMLLHANAHHMSVAYEPLEGRRRADRDGRRRPGDAPQADSEG
jgi:hypothetical protein